jgi:hypothetical protein
MISRNSGVKVKSITQLAYDLTPFKGDFLDFFFSILYSLLHLLPSDSTVSEDAGIEPMQGKKQTLKQHT